MAARDALIVAVGRYTDAKLRRLRAPAADADSLRAVLKDPAIGGFRVDVASDESERDLRRRLARFFSDRVPDDLLLLHFSCHGIKDDRGELYLAATDTESDPDLLSATGIASGWLNDQISRCRSKRIVVLLDCCFSGSFRLGLQARAGAGVDVGGHLGGRGRAVITASNAMEYAFEGDRLSGAGEPSIFTGAVVEGLASGEADRDGDGMVSIDELYDYVYDHVRDCTPGQTPTKLSTLEGPLFVARSSHRPPGEPAPLDPQIVEGLASHLAGLRLGAVEELAGLLASPDPATALAARRALEGAADDDSRAVSARVARALAPPPVAEASAPAAAAAIVAPVAAVGPDVAASFVKRRRAELLVAVSACLVFVSPSMPWDAHHETAWEQPEGAVTLVATVVLMLAVLRAFDALARWRTAVLLAIVAGGLLVSVGAVVDFEGEDGAGRALGGLAGVGIVFGGWLGLCAGEARPWAPPAAGEVVAALGGLLVIASLWMPWDAEGTWAWALPSQAVAVAALAGSIVAMTLLRRAGPRFPSSEPAASAVALIGAALVARALDGGAWEQAGPFFALVGGLFIAGGGLAARLLPRRRR